jgi:hypothetical protein
MDIAEKINETGNYSSLTKYDTTRPWVTRKLEGKNDVRRGLPASGRNKTS